MKIKHFVLATCATLALAGVAKADDFKPKAAGVVMLNVRISDIAPDAGDAIKTTAGAATGLNAHVSDQFMPSLGLSYFLTDNIALEVIATTTQHKIKAQGGTTNVEVKKTWVLPPVVAVQYHFAPKAKFSPYVGAGVNYMLFYNGTNENGFQLKVKNGFGTALQAGADIATSGPFSINVDVKKVFFKTDATDAKNGLKSSVNLDPWVYSVGVGYKF